MKQRYVILATTSSLAAYVFGDQKTGKAYEDEDKAERRMKKLKKSLVSVDFRVLPIMRSPGG